MPVYELEANGKTFEVEAPTMEAAVSALKAPRQQDVGAVEGGGRALARGVPVVGSFLDELNAATNAALQPAFEAVVPEGARKAIGAEHIPGETFGERYESELATQRGMDKSYDEANPVLSPALQITGGVASGGALLKAAPAVGKVILGTGGRTLAGKMAASSASGAALGFGHGFGSGEGSLEDRLISGGKGAAFGGLTGAAFPVLAKGLGKAYTAFTKQAAPTLDKLRQSSQRLYKQADRVGLTVSKDSVQNAVDDMTAKLRGEGFRPRMHPKVAVALDEIVSDSANDLTLQQAQQLRRVAQAAGKSTEPDEQRLGGILVDLLDDYLENLGASDVVAGNAQQATALLKQARNLWSRYRKAETIENLMRRAELSAPNFSGSGAENAIRTEFRSLAKNAKKMRMFTKTEQRAIERVAKGGPLGNALRMLGKFAPTGVVSSALSGGAGYAVGGPVGAVALPAAGFAARQGATLATKSNARAASELMRRGGPLAPSQKFVTLTDYLRGYVSGGTPAAGLQIYGQPAGTRRQR